jgi:DNA-binding transcriptional ArsR family regulator
MATYMVTDILSDTDPLKNNVRESSLRLLSATLLLKDETSTEKAVEEIHECVLRVVSLLDVAFVTGRITEMNTSVLKREFQSLLDYISKSSNESSSSEQKSSFSASFFEVQKPEQKSSDQSSLPRFSTLGSVPTPNTLSSDQGDRGSFAENKATFKKPHGRPSSYAGNVAKNERRAAIFNLLREKKEISVRDLANVVTDCSEKTLQRELLQLVEEGILNKEGERRWSRYSLVI